METTNPIYFRNQPLGCTATIVALMYQEHQIAIPPTIAGLLCSAILSDTLMFRSPTCTMLDERMAKILAKTAGIDITEHAEAMFNAGAQLGERSPDELFHMDFKCFHAKNRSLAVSQITSVSGSELHALKSKMITYMTELLPSSGLDMMFLMMTNIIGESTELLFVGKRTEEIVAAAFGEPADEHSIVLSGVVSRKKQLMAPLMTAIEDFV